MIKGEKANRAVVATIDRIDAARRSNADGLGRLPFVFPRVRTTRDGDWKDGTAIMMAAVAIARDPSVRVESVPKPITYDRNHSIPSRLVLIDGVVEVEYHVSRRNMERLLKVGCLVIQPYKGGKKVLCTCTLLALGSVEIGVTAFNSLAQRGVKWERSA